MDHIEKIRAALPKHLDATNYSKVQQSLQMCLTSIQNAHDDEKCFAVLKTGIMCLIKITHLLVSTYPVENGDSILNLILEILTAASDHGTKSSSLVASFITSACLDIILSEKFAILIRIDVLNRLNFIFECIHPSLKNKLLQTEFLKSNQSKLFQLVLDVGDYEFQVCLMEFFCRLIPRKQRRESSLTMIKDPDIRQAYLAMRDSYFELDCRQFLNYVNRNQDTDERKVFSFPCRSIIFGTVQLQKPSDLGYNDFWWDINMGSKRINIFCESLQPSSQTSIDDGWDNVSIWQKDVDKCVCHEEEDQLHVKLYIKSTAQCIPPACENDPTPIMHIVTSQQHDLRTVLCQFFGKKTVDSDKRDGSLSSTQKAMKTHIFGRETSLSFMSKERKVSVPSEPMSTPASSFLLGSVISQSAGTKSRKASSACSPQTIEPLEKQDRSQVTCQISDRPERKSSVLSNQRSSQQKRQPVLKRDGKESHQNLVGTQRQTGVSQLSGKMDSLLSRSRSRQSEKKKSTKSSVQCGDKRTPTIFIDEEQSKQRQENQTACGYTRYAFRDSTNRLNRSRERADSSQKKKEKIRIQTVSAHEVESECLNHESMKEKMMDHKSKSKKDVKNKKPKQKAETEGIQNTQTSQLRNKLNKNSEESKKPSSAPDSKGKLDDGQVINCASNKKRVSNQPLQRRETRSKLVSLTASQRDEQLVQKQKTRKDKAFGFESSTDNQAKSDYGISCGHTSPGLQSLQKNSVDKSGESVPILVSDSPASHTQSIFEKTSVADQEPKTQLYVLYHDEDYEKDSEWIYVTGASVGNIQSKGCQERSIEKDPQQRKRKDGSNQDKVPLKSHGEGSSQRDLQKKNPQEGSEQKGRHCEGHWEKSKQNEQDKNKKKSIQINRQAKNSQERSKQSKPEKDKEQSKQSSVPDRNYQEGSKQNRQEKDQERSEQNKTQAGRYRERSKQNDRQEGNGQQRLRQNDQEKDNDRSKQNKRQEKNYHKEHMEDDRERPSSQNELRERNDTERVEQNDRQKMHYQEKHCKKSDSRNTVSGEQEGKKRHSLAKTAKKNEPFPVKSSQKNKTPVKEIDSQAEDSSSSFRKNAYLIHPMLAAQECEKDEDNNSTEDKDSQEQSGKNYKYKNLEDMVYGTNSMLPKSKHFSDSRSKSGRKPECFISNVDNLGNISRQKRTTDGSTFKLMNSHKKGKPAKSASDKKSPSSARRLKERELLSFEESSESLEDYGLDKESERSAIEADSPGLCGISYRKKARFAQTGNLQTHKEKLDKRSSSSAAVGRPRSLASLDSSIPPIKFISPDPWTRSTGKDLYQVTPDDCEDRGEEQNMDSEKGGPSLLSERNSQKRPKAGSAQKKSSYRKSLATGRSIETSDVESKTSEKKSEVSWIAEYKSQSTLKTTSKKTYQRNPGSSPNLSFDVRLQPEFDLIETTRTFRREGPVIITSEHSFQNWYSPFTISGESAQSAEHSDVDGKVSQKSKESLNVAQTPGTSFCGSAVSQQSFLSQLSDRLASVQTDINLADIRRKLQYTEEQSPSSGPSVIEMSPLKTAPVTRSSNASKRQQSKLGEKSQQLKKFGLLSGPSSIVRPSKSSLKRKFGDAFSDSEDEGDEILQTKQLHFQPRQLFPGVDVNLSDSKKKNSKENEKSCVSYKGLQKEKTAVIEASATARAAEGSEVEDSSSLDDAQSSLHSEGDVEETGGILATVVKELGCEVQKQLRTQELQVQQLAIGALKLSNNRVNKLWTEDKKQWEQIVGDFKVQIDKELSFLEKEVADFNRVEKKSQAVFMEQLKMLTNKREKLQKGVETARRCYDHFTMKSRHTQSHTQEVQRKLESQMKEEMDTIKKKMLQDLHHQQLQRMKESIYQHFF